MEQVGKAAERRGALRGGVDGARKPQARKGRDKQEKVEQPQVINERMDQLVRLKKASDEASQDLSDAIKKAAEDSGYLASVVRKIVVAKAGDGYAEKKREAEQLALLFDEVKG